MNPRPYFLPSNRAHPPHHPRLGFGPFQNGSGKNATDLRTASWDELASTFVATGRAAGDVDGGEVTGIAGAERTNW